MVHYFITILPHLTWHTSNVCTWLRCGMRRKEIPKLEHQHQAHKHAKANNRNQASVGSACIVSRHIPTRHNQWQYLFRGIETDASLYVLYRSMICSSSLAWRLHWCNGIQSGMFVPVSRFNMIIVHLKWLGDRPTRCVTAWDWIQYKTWTQQIIQ